MNANNFVNYFSLTKQASVWHTSQLFQQIVIDNFFYEDIATQLAAKFPNFTADVWHEYENPLEVKKHVITGTSFLL